MLNTTLDHQHALLGPRRMRCSPLRLWQRSGSWRATTRARKQGKQGRGWQVGHDTTRHDTQTVHVQDLVAGGGLHTGLYLKDGQYLGTQRSRSRSTLLGPSSQSQSGPNPTVSHRHASRQKYRSSFLCGNVATGPIQSVPIVRAPTVC
jgi:hypothetical protein